MTLKDKSNRSGSKGLYFSCNHQDHPILSARVGPKDLGYQG